VQALAPREQAVGRRAAGRRRQEHFHDDGGVDDDHRESRSARITAAGDIVGVTAALDNKRSRISLGVGRSAARRTSAIK
jgi:hypothetical protein